MNFLERRRIEILGSISGIDITRNHGTDLQNPEAVFCFSINSESPNPYEISLKDNATKLVHFFGKKPQEKVILQKGDRPDLPQNGVNGWAGWWPSRNQFPRPLELKEVLTHFLVEILGRETIADFLGSRIMMYLGKRITANHFDHMRFKLYEIIRRRQLRIRVNIDMN